jgi:GT2 family glycosyltransferase
MSDITVLLTAYRRPTLLRPQFDAIRAQTVPARALWLWANEPSPRLLAESEALPFDRVVLCSPNAFFHARFALALSAATEFVALFDDDALPGPEWFANCLRTMERTPGILGSAGVRLTSDCYRDRTLYGWHAPTTETIEVDLVGHAWFLRREWLPYLFAAPAVTGTNGEDIELAARAWRLGGVRCFCPPHAPDDRHGWGSLRGEEQGSDEAAASRRAGHLDERDLIVAAEVAAGWQPLYARPSSLPRGETRGKEETTAPMIAPNGLRDLVPESAQRVHCLDGNTVEDLAPGSVDCLLCERPEVLPEPERLLRRARHWLAPEGRLVARFPNARHHAHVTALLQGSWDGQAADTLRYFTRREAEKLLERAGFTIEEVRPVPGPGYDDWQAGRRDEVRIGALHINGLPPEEAEEFYATAFCVSARPAPLPDYGLTSIVILTYNELDYTRMCVDSLRLCTDEPHELIFVDNGSTDGTPEYLLSLSGVRVIRNETNLGFPRAVNQGIRAATGKQVLLLNNDTIVTTGWLRRLLRALDEPKVGLVGPCSNRVSGEQQIEATYDDLVELDGFAWQWGKAHDGQREPTDRLVGFCLLVRRELIEAIGELDEQFGIGCYEDDDYCRRALRAGWRAVIARDAFVHHFGGRTFAGSGVDFAALMSRNRQLFEEKWHDSTPGTVAPADQSTPGTRYVIKETPDGLRLGRTSVVLSGCMIVRNNARTIAAAVGSLRRWVDDLVVVDTGSTDETPDICRRLGARVFHFPWCKSFSAARNESLRHARGRWIFWMDSDDTIDEVNGRGVRELALRDWPADLLGFVVSVRCPSKDPSDPDGYTRVTHVKLIRNRPDLRFEGRIHEQILPAIQAASGRVEFTDLFVVHAGYDTSPEGQKHKLERDLELLHLELDEQPDHPFTLFNLGMTYTDAGRHEEAINFLRRSLEHSSARSSHVRKAYAYLACGYKELGDWRQAFAACEEGLGVVPGDPELRFHRAGLLHARGRLEEAAQGYLDLLHYRPEPHYTSVNEGISGHLARHNLALVYQDLGELARAQEQWQAILAERPGYPAARRALQELEARLQRSANS